MVILTQTGVSSGHYAAVVTKCMNQVIKRKEDRDQAGAEPVVFHTFLGWTSTGKQKVKVKDILIVLILPLN